MRHTYSLKIFIVYLKFKISCAALFLPVKSSNHTPEEMLLLLSHTCPVALPDRIYGGNEDS